MKEQFACIANLRDDRQAPNPSLKCPDCRRHRRNIHQSQPINNRPDDKRETYEDPEKAAAEPTEARRATAENFMVVSWCICLLELTVLKDCETKRWRD